MKSYVKIFCLIILILSPFILIYSQTEQYKFRHLTTEDGLASNYTWSVMRDSQGFMWFTTRAGLCRYDGYNVKVFQYDPSDSTTISELYVKSTICEDANGFIWVGSLNGLNKFDQITETFTRYYRNPDDPHSISSNWMRYIYLDSQGVIWAGTDGNGLNRYNDINDNFNNFLPHPDYSLSNGIRAIFEDSSGIFWVGTANGLYQFDRRTEEFTLIKLIKKKDEKRIANRFTTITEDNEGNIWYCADRIYKYDKSINELSLFTGFSVESAGNPNPTYMNILLEKHGNNQTLWITRGGLYKYDLTAGKLTQIYNDPSDWESYVGGGPKGLYLDPTGLMWIATNSGISILNPRSSQFKSHPDIAEKFNLDAIGFLKDSQGHFWVGGDNGVLRYDVNMKLIYWYKPDKENKKSFLGTVREIIEDNENQIWIICHKDGVYVLDQETNEFLRCKLLKHGKDFKPNNLYDIYEDSQGRLWVASDGLFKRIKNSPEPTTFYLDTSHWRTRNTTHTQIKEDHSGNLWISSLAGALLKQPESDRGTNKFIEYTHDPSDPNSLSNSHIWSVYVDDQGEVWAGTNHGLNRYLPEKDCFERFLMDAEPGTSFIYDIKRDRNGYLWMITANGLIGFNPSAADIAINRVKQYLPFNRISRTKLYKDPEGIIYVGSKLGAKKGFFSFHPDSITKNNNIPPVVLTSFTVRNKTIVLDTAITLKKNLTLSYNENYLSFEFAALDYTKPDQNQYAYMLEGLDEDWIYSGNRRLAYYTEVPPGDYIFKAKGSNSDGYWNEQGTFISITILPPPWKTWWAYSLYILFFISMIVFVLRFYLRRQRLLHNLELEQIQTEKLEELDKLKSRFFENISHEFRTPLTLILGPIDKLKSFIKDKEPKKDLDMMQRNANRLQRLINQLLNLSQIESGKMKLQVSEQNIVNLVNDYVQSFESLAKQKNIDLALNSNEEEIKIYVDKDKMEKILFNLLSNAFKFTGEDGKIEVDVTPLGPPSRGDNSIPKLESADGISNAPSPLKRGMRGVIIKISDTGKGIPSEKLNHIFDRFYQVDDSYTKDQEGSGIGLALTKELVKLHHGEIRATSQPGEGSTFTIYLPAGKEHFKPNEIISSDKSEYQSEDSLDQHPELLTHSESFINENSPSDESKPILLIVEDNADLLSYIRGYLDESYFVLEACDGEEGLQEAIKNIPDLVLSDVMMPKMDGFELCRKLKTDERTSHIPVILLTARASSESKIEGLETGADDYLSKPFDATELKIRIKNLIQQRQ